MNQREFKRFSILEEELRELSKNKSPQIYLEAFKVLTDLHDEWDLILRLSRGDICGIYKEYDKRLMYVYNLL
jgi:hypothetical protein